MRDVLCKIQKPYKFGIRLLLVCILFRLVLIAKGTKVHNTFTYIRSPNLVKKKNTQRIPTTNNYQAKNMCGKTQKRNKWTNRNHIDAKREAKEYKKRQQQHWNNIPDKNLESMHIAVFLQYLIIHCTRTGKYSLYFGDTRYRWIVGTLFSVLFS